MREGAHQGFHVSFGHLALVLEVLLLQNALVGLHEVFFGKTAPEALQEGPNMRIHADSGRPKGTAHLTDRLLARKCEKKVDLVGELMKT